MTQHAEIMSSMARHIEELSGAASIMPTSLAWAVFNDISDDEVDPLVQYACLEHLKSMARKSLAGRFTADGESNPAHTEDLFSNALQERYPIRRAPGEEPIYKRRDLLTEEERAWNLEQLRKSAKARLAHADALEAEAMSRAA